MGLGFPFPISDYIIGAYGNEFEVLTTQTQILHLWKYEYHEEGSFLPWKYDMETVKVEQTLHRPRGFQELEAPRFPITT